MIMRPADFHKVLNGQEALNRLQVLEETAHRFPYFSAAQVLLANHYWLEGHLDKQLQLEKASLRVADRTFLYNLLQEDSSIVQDQKELPDAEAAVEEKIPAVSGSEEENESQVGLPDHLIPDLQVYDISMAPDLTTELQKEPETEEEFDFVGWLNKLESEEDDSKPVESAPKSKVDIIDRFIENDPQISKRADVKFYSPQEMGRKSVEDDFGFVSETLAQIYMDQGDTEKAIKAYRSLQLRFPEKSSYFAARLKKLEEQ